MKAYEIWVEGYQTSGMEGAARFLGTEEASTFDEAVRLHVSKVPSDEQAYFRRSDGGEWSFWGCRIFDNESDARKSFG